MKKAFRFVYAMQYLFQVAYCMLTPMALLMGGGWLLHTYCGVGKWIFVVGIVLGVCLGLYSMIAFLLASGSSVDPTKKEDEPHG